MHLGAPPRGPHGRAEHRPLPDRAAGDLLRAGHPRVVPRLGPLVGREVEHLRRRAGDDDLALDEGHVTPPASQRSRAAKASARLRSSGRNGPSAVRSMTAARAATMEASSARSLPGSSTVIFEKGRARFTLVVGATMPGACFVRRATAVSALP